MALTDWIDDVLHFWFREVQPAQWFRRDERVDAAVKERYAHVYDSIRGMRPEEHDDPMRALAAVIVLDQFPRNMFRGAPRAFESDELALATSRAAIERGFDRALNANERMFLYMPWQHSEDRAAQARSVELFATLGQEEALDYARQHQEVIDRFGRFPHRNQVLQRTSTADELEFLKTHPGF
jgi:uncharacterized protein (DUF924 family)